MAALSLCFIGHFLRWQSHLFPRRSASGDAHFSSYLKQWLHQVDTVYFRKWNTASTAAHGPLQNTSLGGEKLVRAGMHFDVTRIYETHLIRSDMNESIKKKKLFSWCRVKAQPSQQKKSDSLGLQRRTIYSEVIIYPAAPPSHCASILYPAGTSKSSQIVQWQPENEKLFVMRYWRIKLG